MKLPALKMKPGPVCSKSLSTTGYLKPCPTQNPEAVESKWHGAPWSWNHIMEVTHEVQSSMVLEQRMGRSILFEMEPCCSQSHAWVSLLQVAWSSVVSKTSPWSGIHQMTRNRSDRPGLTSFRRPRVRRATEIHRWPWALGHCYGHNLPDGKAGGTGATLRDVFMPTRFESVRENPVLECQENNFKVLLN